MRRLIGLVLLVTLAGCSSGDSAGPASKAAVPTELRLAVGGESEDGYDPTLGWGRYGSPLFQSTLLRRDADLKVVNDLATGYRVSEGGLVWTVDIRTDANFTDGTPVTSEDVAYTFTKASQSGGLTDVTVLDAATAVDDDTVELKLKKPQSTFVNRLITLGIVPKHAHNEAYGRNPIGSGPYQLVRWDEANSSSWRPTPVTTARSRRSAGSCSSSPRRTPRSPWPRPGTCTSPPSPSRSPPNRFPL